MCEKKKPPILYMIQNNYNVLPTMNMSMIFDSHYFLTLITINNLFYYDCHYDAATTQC